MAVVWPTCRGLPLRGMPVAAECLDLLKPAIPYVLVPFIVPVTPRLLGDIPCHMYHFGLRLDAATRSLRRLRDWRRRVSEC